MKFKYYIKNVTKNHRYYPINYKTTGSFTMRLEIAEMWLKEACNRFPDEYFEIWYFLF